MFLMLKATQMISDEDILRKAMKLAVPEAFTVHFNSSHVIFFLHGSVFG